MKRTISARMENIFAHAVALEQSGRLKNIIHVDQKEVYIQNMDHTVLLNFRLPEGEVQLKEPFSFRASDYDSNIISLVEGKITFHQKSGEFLRKKICNVAGTSFEGVKQLWDSLNELAPKKPTAVISLTANVIPLLEDGLSHIEFSCVDGKMILRQRDIYSGTVIEMEKGADKGLGIIAAGDSLPEEFGPVGMRSVDFVALFSFNSSIQFEFFKDTGFFRIKAPNYKMTGIVSLCVYDELGEFDFIINPDITNEDDEHGREKQKKRLSKQKADRTTQRKSNRMR